MTHIVSEPMRKKVLSTVHTAPASASITPKRGTQRIDPLVTKSPSALLYSAGLPSYAAAMPNTGVLMKPKPA